VWFRSTTERLILALVVLVAVSAVLAYARFSSAVDLWWAQYAAAVGGGASVSAIIGAFSPPESRTYSAISALIGIAVGVALSIYARRRTR
jgi:hypothetical protein